MIGGGVWSLFRFVVVTLLVLRLVPEDPLFRHNVLWVGAPALVITALFLGSAFFRHAARHYVPLLRIGMLIAAVTDAIVVLTGSYVPAAERAGIAVGEVSRLIFIITYGILAVDLLIFAGLISYGDMERTRGEAE